MAVFTSAIPALQGVVPKDTYSLGMENVLFNQPLWTSNTNYTDPESPVPFHHLAKVKPSRGFPGGAVVKSPPASAGTRVRALVQKDPTCRRATKPVRHNYWACALEPASHNYWAGAPRLLKPKCVEPVLCNKRSQRNKTPAHRNEEQPPFPATRESPCAAVKTQHSQK